MASEETTHKCEDFAGALLPAYCAGEVDEEQRNRFEAHLLECDACWTELQRLDAIVRALRTDKSLSRSTFTSQIAGYLGVSGMFTKLLAGHRLHAVICSVLYAGLYAVALPVEIAYRWEKFGVWSIMVAPILFAWIAATTLLALVMDWRAVLRGRSGGLWRSVAVFALSAAALYAVLRPFLPDYPITGENNLQSYTAQAAYLKSVLYFLPLALLYIAVPFHFIASMQRELAAGRHEISLDLLAGRDTGVAPRDAPYVPVLALAILFGLGAATSLVMAFYLLDHLKIGPNTNLFTQLIEARWLLYLATGLESLIWYYLSLNELKRECVAFTKLRQGVIQGGAKVPRAQLEVEAAVLSGF